MAQAWTRTETVQASQVTGTLTDFPALFSRTHNDFRTIGNGGHVANANGYDLCLYSDAGLTALLKMETELYVAATGQVIKWGKVASIATSTVVYWGYGDTGISSSQDDVANVWDSSFKAVYHFGSASSLGLLDSTANNYDLTNVNAVTAVAGQVHGAANFVAASAQALTVASFDLNATALSIETWAWASSWAQSASLLARAPINGEWSLIVFTDVILRGGGVTSVSASPPSNSAWHQLVATITGTTGTVYFDGASAASGSVDAIPDTVDTFGIGTFPDFPTSFPWDGRMDEIRISNTARSAAWVEADYKNLSAPTTFWGLGSESAVGGRTTKNTRSSPLGTEIGMNWRSAA